MCAGFPVVPFLLFFMGKEEDWARLGVGYFERANLLAVGRVLHTEGNKRNHPRTTDAKWSVLWRVKLK